MENNRNLRRSLGSSRMRSPLALAMAACQASIRSRSCTQSEVLLLYIIIVPAHEWQLIQPAPAPPPRWHPEPPAPPASALPPAAAPPYSAFSSAPACQSRRHLQCASTRISASRQPCSPGLERSWRRRRASAKVEAPEIKGGILARPLLLLLRRRTGLRSPLPLLALVLLLLLWHPLGSAILGAPAIYSTILHYQHRHPTVPQNELTSSCRSMPATCPATYAAIPEPPQPASASPRPSAAAA